MTENTPEDDGMTIREAQLMRREYLGRALEQRGDKSIREVLAEVNELVQFVLEG